MHIQDEREKKEGRKKEKSKRESGVVAKLRVKCEMRKKRKSNNSYNQIEEYTHIIYSLS
jgi:hypothetical protein